MSTPSIAHESARSRHLPTPLKFDSTFKASSGTPQSPTRLYDLPSAISLSPPNSPRSVIRSNSPPTSPRSRTSRNARPSPSPGGRNRSQTPSKPAQSDLEKFSGYCRSWYFNQDEEASRLMTQTMASLPPSQRAPYSRLQASIRSAYHRSVNARRTAEFNAHLNATQPGGSLTPHARLEPNGPIAKKERYERFERFLRTWCTMGMPGPQPFFQSIWAIMRLQALPEGAGGAGRNRIQWELDDAVFKEAAGKDFMLEAIDILKGVLGFEEAPCLKRTSSTLSDSSFQQSSTTHSRSTSQPLLRGQSEEETQSKRTNRARAPSDPFLDTPGLPQSIESSSSHRSTLSSASSDEPLTPTLSQTASATLVASDVQTSQNDEEEEYLRLWTSSPHISNPEYTSLVALFPQHITRRALPYFPISVRPRALDLEEGEEEHKEVLVGTGTIRISPKQRNDGWEGGWWTSLVLWWRRVFC